MGIDSPVISFASPAFADSDEEAEKALALFGTCPVADKAIVKIPYMPTDLPTWYDVVMSHYLSDHHYAVDNMWTSASAERAAAGHPDNPRHAAAASVALPLAELGSVARPAKTWPTASKTTSTWRSTARGRTPADDAKYGDWARSNMAAMSHLATGIQLADENLGQRPARFATDEAMDRLDKARAAYDPDGLFNSWMGRL